ICVLYTESPISKDLLPCKICGRHFFSKVLVKKKHVPICQKTATKKRRVFDSSRQRAEGTDISTVKPIKPKPEPLKKQSNWQRKHEEFIVTIRAAKGLNQFLKDGGPLPPPPPPSYDPGKKKKKLCPYCQQRFSENAADRHIKFCKEQASRISNKAKFPGSDKPKPPARTQYRPPPPKVANSPAVSTVSSRLPQRLAYGQSAGTGIPSSKTSSTGTVRSVSSGYSPLRNTSYGLTSSPSEGNMKPKVMVSQSLLRNPPSGIGMNKKKVQNVSDFLNDVKNENEIHFSTPRTKVCHLCGTKMNLISSFSVFFFCFFS
uniref:Zinc finger C2HC domain-containing protein 1A n=1 Tax=Cyprinus carpio TaxID=7962 RepID=A0A8C1R3I8_CYPCA